MIINEGLAVTIPIGIIISAVGFIAFVVWTFAVYHHRIEKNKTDIQFAFDKIRNLAESINELSSWEMKTGVNIEHIREQYLDLKNEIVSLRERIDMILEQKRG